VSKLGEVITLTLNDGLYNAGIVGFLRICNKAHLPYEYGKEDNQFSFDSSILEKFTEHYFDTMIETFQDDIIYTEIMNRISNTEGNRNKKEFTTSFHEDFQYITEKMKRASYLSAYEIIRARGESYNYLETISKIKSNENYDDKIAILEELKMKMQQHKDVFMLKDIAYIKIQPFWSGIAFLHKTKNIEEFGKAFDEKIMQGCRSYADKNSKKGNVSCIQCGSHMNRVEASLMSWINDVGVDSTKKSSAFWNFNVDAYLCPICTLIYSCIPLGFALRSSEGIFLNQNNSVRKLYLTNATLPIQEKVEKKDVFYWAFDRHINNEGETVTTNEIENIQVIRKTERGYLFNILSKDKLIVLNDCRMEWKYLVGKYYKKGNEYINVYREVLNKLLNGGNLYPIIYEALWEGIRNNSSVAIVPNLLVIQSAIYPKAGKKMDSKYNYYIIMQGDHVRTRMLHDNQNENKIKFLSHRLISSLKIRNPYDFIDVILRLYMSLGIAVPNVFMNTLSEEDEFLSVGYAFLTGLNGGATKDTNESGEMAQ